MQQLHNSEAGGAPVADRDGRELRIGRLQRQKVRVSRKRILESAIKASGALAGFWLYRLARFLAVAVGQVFGCSGRPSRQVAGACSAFCSGDFGNFKLMLRSAGCSNFDRNFREVGMRLGEFLVFGGASNVFIIHVIY